ncbi:LamG-like jellyroll fold domain-containing protein [Paenibacillus gansuensis]|uniref:LamG-like jellyroll fold domain-containing protein n=1 Tax=Paenibacillus gansuensis TaxID=306542 RepID=A0ABW5PAW4_9BACL
MAGLRQGLAAEYLFNGDTQDSSGNERHGKAVGAALCKNRFNNPNSAYCFDGVDDYIVVDPAPALNQEAFSLSVWCRYDKNAELSGWNNAIVSQDGHHARSFQLSTRENYIAFHRFLLEPDLAMERPLCQEFWYHIAITYEAGMFKLYRNGVLISDQPGAFTVNSEEPLYIGCKSSNEPALFFHGVIDDLRLYNRAVSADEVEALYLENGWVPEKEPQAAVIPEDDIPVLEGVEDLSINVKPQDIQAAVDWYIKHLGFILLQMDPDQKFYFLRLNKGPNLIVRCTDIYDQKMDREADKEDVLKPAPFIFASKRNIESLRENLTYAGASFHDVKDVGFGYFLNFQDPFGHNWCILREKIG